MREFTCPRRTSACILDLSPIKHQVCCTYQYLRVVWSKTYSLRGLYSDVIRTEL